MNTIEFFLVPILLLVIYYLTYINMRHRKETYNKHFITESIAMGPVWGKDSNNLKFPNYKVLVLIGIMTALCYYMFFASDVGIIWGISFIDWFKGYLFAVLIIVTARQLYNFFLYKYMATNADAVTGSVTITKAYQLKTSQYQALVYSLPIIGLTILQPTDTLIGASCACVALFIGLLRLQSRNREVKSELPSHKATAADENKE